MMPYSADTGGLLTELSGLFGVSDAAILLLLAVVISVGISIGVSYRVKNKQVGAATFFFVMGFFAFLGWINWLVLIVPLILMAAYMFYVKGDNNNG